MQKPASRVVSLMAVVFLFWITARVLHWAVAGLTGLVKTAASESPVQTKNFLVKTGALHYKGITYIYIYVSSRPGLIGVFHPISWGESPPTVTDNLGNSYPIRTAAGNLFSDFGGRKSVQLSNAQRLAGRLEVANPKPFATKLTITFSARCLGAPGYYSTSTFETGAIPRVSPEQSMDEIEYENIQPLYGSTH